MKAINPNKKPWYRYPMVWMLIAIPSSAVIMGVIMINLAINSSDGLVIDDYYRKGKEINRSLTRDKKATDYALHAQLYWKNDEQIHIKLQANEAEAYHGKEITLYLRHPTRDGFDQTSKLIALGDGLYQADVNKALVQGSWKVEVSTNTWRLQGRLRWPEEQRLLLSSDAKSHD